jgi:Ca-activated chloride channel family protein
MSFAHPVLLLTLLVVPLAIGLYALAERRRMRYAIRFTNLELLASVAGGRSWRRYVPPLVFVLALGTLCLAVARPQVKTRVPSEQATVILVVDASGSMQASDVKPTRLGAAQEAVRTFLNRVPKRLRVGLIVFAGEPQVAAPPTTDRELLRESVDSISMFSGFGGTAIGDALAEAVALGREAVGDTGAGGAASIAYRTAAPRSRSSRSPVSILLLSDGAQTRGELQPLDGAKRARAAGFPVYTIALGTPNGRLDRPFGGGFGFGGSIPVPPDPATLKSIAEETGGQFFAAQNADAVKAAYASLGSRLGRVPGKNEETYAFLAGAAALLVAAGVLSALWSPRLP